MRVLLSETLHKSGVSALVGRRYRGRGMIFMLHSVVPDTRPYLNQTIRLSAARLEQALRWVRDQGLDIVSLDEALRRLRNDHPGRFVVFTFDDGYRDNVTHALPIMARHNAPFTIYIPSQMLTRQINGWWLGILPLVRDNDAVEIAAMNCRFDTSTQALKRRAMTAIGSWVFADGGRAQLLSETFARYRVDLSRLVEREAMSSEDVRRIAVDPLVTIGGHTVSHRFLSRLPADEAEREIRDNKRDLETLLDRPVEHFSFPYGAAGPREADLARAAGFDSAVTTGNGTLFPAHASIERRFALPRETLDEFDTNGCLHCRTRGVYQFIKSRGGSPIADFRL